MPAFTTAQTIHNIRYGVQGEDTRIVLDMSEKSDYKLQVLTAPPRLALDFPKQFDAPMSLKADPRRQVQSVRYGVLEDGGKRIVFDLRGFVEIRNHFYLPPSSGNSGHRLVLDIRPAEAPVSTPSLPLQAPQASSLNLSALNSVDIPAYHPTQNIGFYSLPTPKPEFLAQPREKYTIVLDAGHGGGDPGSIGAGKVREKDIVLAIARKLKNELEQSGRYNVHLTRTSDYYIQLRERFKKARELNADMFISLHADKLHIPSVRGVSVYTLSETASDKETARLAQQENNAGIVAGVDLGVEETDVANILLDLARRETLNESKLFAELFVQSLKQNQIRYLKNPHRYAGFAVLKAPDIPSVLIESGFLSNDEDAKLLQSNQYQNQLSKAIRQSIDVFFDRLERLNDG